MNVLKNPYKILGVADGSPIDVCKKAYRKLSKIYHPDCPTGDSDKFDECCKAWELIESGAAIKMVTKRSRLGHSSLFTFVKI